ncbi:MAG: hypothetical protein KC729_09335, partial [Candidatus Eisenbacteria bacterium]|nr:hypothetical protein [Candidatus Eisenbacteria bacterium]
MSHALNRDRVFLASILLLAAALRVWTVLVLRNDLRISEPVIDGQLYLESARALAGGSFNPHTVFFQSPLYPLVLSSLVRSTTAVTSTVLGVQILQTILGLGTGVLLFLAARRRAGSAVARIAALLWLLYGPIL